MGKLRDVNELRWRSRGPRLPDTVLDAVTLKIQAQLPPTYRFGGPSAGGRRNVKRECVAMRPRAAM